MQIIEYEFILYHPPPKKKKEKKMTSHQVNITPQKDYKIMHSNLSYLGKLRYELMA